MQACIHTHAQERILTIPHALMYMHAYAHPNAHTSPPPSRLTTTCHQKGDIHTQPDGQTEYGDMITDHHTPSYLRD